MKKRVEWIDIARFFGIWAIVLGHTVNGTSALDHFVTVFQVPLFFVVSGLTFRTDGEILPGLRKRAKRMLVPYAVFAAVSILLFALLGTFASSLSSDFKSASVLPNLGGALYANGRTGYMKWNLPLWFLPCSFVTLLEVSIFERCICNCAGKTVLRLAAIGVTVCMTAAYCAWIPETMLPFQLEQSVTMFGFTEVGILVAAFLRERGGEPLVGRKYLLLGLGMLALGGAINAFNGNISVLAMLFGGSLALYYPSALLCCLGILLLAMQLGTEKVPAKLRGAMTYAGQRTLAILVMHKFPVMVFQLAVPYCKRVLNAGADSMAKTVTGILVSLAVICMCLVVEVPVNKLCPWALGNERK